MSKGVKQEVKLADLVVNPENYRFDPVNDEQKALRTMMEGLGSEVANLARSNHGVECFRHRQIQAMTRG